MILIATQSRSVHIVNNNSLCYNLQGILFLKLARHYKTHDRCKCLGFDEIKKSYSIAMSTIKLYNIITLSIELYSIMTLTIKLYTIITLTTELHSIITLTIDLYNITTLTIEFSVSPE